jgi:hypothetical protein
VKTLALTLELTMPSEGNDQLPEYRCYPLLQTVSLKNTERPAGRNRRASAARSAAGRPAKRTSGSALAAMSGTRSTREASAQLACTSGLKRSASRAADGRLIRSGMRATDIFVCRPINGEKEAQHGTASEPDYPWSR